VISEYGDYEAAANSDIVEAAAFLLLANDPVSRAKNWIMGT
jgi:hypothetical protein